MVEKVQIYLLVTAGSAFVWVEAGDTSACPEHGPITVATYTRTPVGSTDTSMHGVLTTSCLKVLNQQRNRPLTVRCWSCHSSLRSERVQDEGLLQVL